MTTITIQVGDFYIFFFLYYLFYLFICFYLIYHFFLGEFRGALCNFCNLNKKKLLFIPIYIHNLSGFDSHLIVKAMKLDKTRFSVLPRNAERIVTMSIGNYKFIDSSSFLPESLESLVRNLKDKDPGLFIQTESWLVILRGNSTF